MKKFLKTVLTTMMFAGAAGTANAALVNSYDFTNGLTDTLGNGNALIANGGSVSDGKYHFSANQGLRLENALKSTTNFAVEMRFQVNDNTSGYNKLLDFQNLGSDHGLYIHNGLMAMYPNTARAGAAPTGSMMDVAISRAGGLLEVFLNGALALSLADTGNIAVAGANILNFFVDDTRTGQREAFIGSVDFIRIHDDKSTFGQSPVVSAVPVPAALPLLLTGLAGIGLVARRRKA